MLTYILVDMAKRDECAGEEKGCTFGATGFETAVCAEAALVSDL